MGPRVKKARSGKAKDLPTSAEADREIIEAGEDKINTEPESQEEVPKTEVDNGGEDAPPLKKSRGRQNVKKGAAKPAKAAVSQVDEDNVDGAAEKVPHDYSVDGNDKPSSDNDDEVPVKKVRGRTKKPSKDEVVGKEAPNGEEDLNGAAPGARKGRQRKKKVDDELEVMPKKKDRGAGKNEPTPEEKIDGSTVSNSGDSKLKASKRDKKQPAKRAGKSKKDQDGEEKLVEEDEMEDKNVENGEALGEQDEVEHVQDVEEGGGDAKPPRKAARGKAAAKTTDGAPSKKAAGRGKKAAKVEDLTEDDDVPVNGKKLRVLVEH
ncbi:high mobility group nucleosome-binding domain-containing protein 5-like isoform X2 [Hetaerina americana]